MNASVLKHCAILHKCKMLFSYQCFIFFAYLFFFFFFETGRYVVQAGLALEATLMPQLPGVWNHRHVPPCLASYPFFDGLHALIFVHKCLISTLCVH